MLRSNVKPIPAPPMIFDPIPSKTLAKRFIETNVAPKIVQAILFSKGAKQFVHERYVLVSNEEVACVVPSDTPLQTVLAVMNDYALQQKS